MKYLTERSKLLAVYFLSMIGLSLLNIFINVIPTTASNNDLDLTYSLLSQILCMGAIPLVGALWARKGSSSIAENVNSLLVDYGYAGKLDPVCILLLIPMAISFFGVTRLLSSVGVLILTLAQYSFPMSASTIYTSPWDLVAQLLLTAMLPAIFEEFTHRGLALDALKRRGSEASAIVLSGLLFALMHTNILQFLYAFAGGCIFGLLAVKSRSIYPSMILHFTNNAIATLNEYADQYPDGAFGFLAKMNDFWYSSTIMSLLFGLVLAANAVLFVFLTIAFVKRCPKKELVKPVTLIKGKLYVDSFRPDGKPKLIDNAFLYATVIMTTAMTASTYVWGLLR